MIYVVALGLALSVDWRWFATGASASACGGRLTIYDHVW